MKQQQAISAIPYILAFLALLYLALPHVVECYEAYARPWNTREEMTNADVAAKQAHHEDKNNTVWEMFGETEVNPDRDILPGEPVTPSQPKSILPGQPVAPSQPKSILPGQPVTPSQPKPVTPSQPSPPDHAVEPPVNKPSERTNKRIMDKSVQKPSRPHPAPAPEKKHDHKVAKVPISHPHPAPKHTSGEPIQGPRAPALDPNEPSPSDSGNGKNGGGVYPNIYGPDSLDAPGSKDPGGDFPPFDYLPAAEFPAGPLQPSPYLNDFSKMLKT